MLLLRIVNTNGPPTTGTNITNSPSYTILIAKTDSAVENGTIDSEETLGIQPLYRNYLLQTIYEYSFKSAIRVDKNDPIFQHVPMKYGGPWTVPPAPSSNNNRRAMHTLRKL